MTFYDILGLSRDATPDEIRAAYRALAKQYHPDLVQQAGGETKHLAEERLKAINEAYATLSDPGARARYHQIMWTSRDPARRYQKIFPQRKPSANGHAQSQRNANPAEHILIQLSALRADLDYLRHRQHIKRRRFMLGALFSTLIVFFFMWLENLTLSTTQYDLIPWVGSFLFAFLSCELLVALPIIINASAMRIPRFPGISTPMGFSVSIFAGTTLSCVAIMAPRTGNAMAQATFITGGLAISLALLAHVYLIRRLSRLQEMTFHEEVNALKRRIRNLERQLEEYRKN
jgi:hypothetical protein